jgi:hypothetical protein
MGEAPTVLGCVKKLPAAGYNAAGRRKFFFYFIVFLTGCISF